jgi:large subunit ribosomal protein L25
METTGTIGKLTAKPRRQRGKEAASKLRQGGWIPAICYGGQYAPISLSVDPVALKRALDPAKRKNTLIELTIEEEGKTESLNVMLKDYQVDELKQVVLHADFMRVALDQVIDVAVPLQLIGKAEGVKLGGTQHQVFRTLPVRCLPAKIPTMFEIDITALLIGMSLQVKHLVVPEGVTVNLPENQTIALVMAPRKVEEVAVVAEVGVEGAAPAEGAEPAAEGAAAPAVEEKEAKKGGKEKKEK